ncbi:gamma-tubulin complex component 6 [Vanessa atalanta]|uniref:gamma-tubulin complex component 6 n=1 Tax=Vanessa atalanta TaxID=42275 RepID=UPI001FCD321C|nr:gamma-tubulin complex component 6 [Vanessa atalanta]
MNNSASGIENAGVYELITKLCEKMAEKYCDNNRLSLKLLASKLRAQSYEIILKRSSTGVSSLKADPIKDLLSHQFVSQLTVKNVAEYKRSIDLKKNISNIRNEDFGEKQDLVNNVLRLLIGLQNSINEDLSSEMFQNPFSFGLFDEMLPKPKREIFGSPQPYSYFPKHVFELPYSLKRQENILDNKKSQCYTEYTVESFDSRSFIPDIQSQPGVDDMKSFQSPMSIPSMTSTALSPYTESTIFNYPRLIAPRDLYIPKSDLHIQNYMDVNVKVSLAGTSVKSDIPDMFKVNTDESLNVWEIVTQLDKDIPEDIWEEVSKMPIVKERQLIASSSREMCLWRSIYGSELSDLKIISEKQFIRHIMYLIIGVETNSFPFSEASNCFYIKDNLVLEAISKEHLRGYIAPLLLVGTYYSRLYNFAFNLTAEDHFHTKGLVFEAAREVIRRYLLEFRLTATEIYEEYCKNKTEELNCMPTLLQILHHMEPLIYEIETIASIYKMVDPDSTSIPHGAELMSYLFNEISLVTHRKTSLTLFNSLFCICRVYFKFIERFIFEGELDDIFNEFFIRKDNQYVNSRSKRYWDKGFHITLSVAVPDFLRPLATFILLCGKSLRLLKLCNPSDPLVLLISSDHPSVRCCASFEELERQQEILDVYRTRCLFVSGETVTFEQILLKREAERKAFTEMASLKQAETMEKIVAERKRLAQLIIAEKQHSLRILEAAMAEAKASKTKVKKREGKLCKLEEAAKKATEEVDSKLRDDEKSKIMEYYSKLNMEVEKSKIHTEWKIKRLQLDQSRMQLLSTEERNLKREKLELEHQRNEVMAMSIQSDFKSDDDLDNVDNNNGDMENNSTADSTPSAEIIEEPECSAISEFNRNREKTQNSSDVLSAICNVAKSIFGVSKSKAGSPCDNEVEVDIQGNVVNALKEINHETKADQTSNDVIGANLDNAIDNLRFLESKQEALKNKQKVMAHEFGQIDTENNQAKDLSPTVNFPALDEENNENFWTPNAEAKRNKQKVLGAEFAMIKQEVKEIVSEPRTEAQKEALLNRQKVLGVEYNLPYENIAKKEPANVAQEEAIRNKNRVLGSVYEKTMKTVAKFDAAKKSALRLNLKPYSDTMITKTSSVTPNTGAVTPGELFPGLDLETPTTAEMPLDGAMTSDIFTPRSEGSRGLESAKVKPDKEFLTSDGFNFSLIVEDEAVAAEDLSDAQTEVSPESSPSKSVDSCISPLYSKRSLFNIIDGSYNLESFDPFGVKQLQNYSKDYFNHKINEDSNSVYTHPAVLMEEVKKRPYNNIFMSHCDHEEEDQKISCDNIATLTACLQRSVMLPLTYQLEVVNNSILTHFLVNLDMYEHLRSLKDYFFLMDGEFSRSICHNLFTKLTKTLNPQELLNFATLHNILDKALGSSISHVHKFSENLSFTITESPLSFQHSSPDVLQCLSLTYSVSWPLNIILSQEALLRYAKVFQFLIKMRRIFWVLSEDFVTLKLTAKLSRQHSRKLLNSSQYISVQIYRHNMASLIRALDNYIVTTCILTSWTEFEKDLKKAKTLDDLYECHVVYIKKVLFRCLLNNRSTPVMKLLNDIFTVILKFNRVLKAGEWRQNAPNGCFTHTSYVQLEELFHLFEKLAKYLHKVITKLMECGYQRHLVELLTMVNLNGYYDPDRSKEDTNISLQST